MKNLALSAFVIAAMSGSAMAQEVITSYENFGQPGDQAFSPVGTQADNVTGNVLTRGPGLTPSAAGNSISATGWDTADQATDYFTFGFSVDAGFEVNLSELWIGARSSNTGPGFLGLFYSGDNFSSNLFTFVQVGTAFNNQIIDLNSLTGLTGDVEFRIAPLNNISANGGTVGGGGTFRLGDHFGDGFSEMRFVGTVIPTPGAIALFAAAGLAAARRRRA